MRLILAGTRSFGCAVLDAVQDAGHDVACVWAPTEDRLGAKARSRRLGQRDKMDPETVASYNADLIVAAHSHDFVSSRARGATRLGGIGYHPSALPRHRGRSAVEWTVAMGDRIAGGSVYWLADAMDAGPLAAQEFCHVRPSWDASDLWRKELFPMGVRLITKTLADLDRGVIVEVPQDEACATFEPAFELGRVYRPDLLTLGSAPAGYAVQVGRGSL